MPLAPRTGAHGTKLRIQNVRCPVAIGGFSGPYATGSIYEYAP
jgi:hypothetical protein